MHTHSCQLSASSLGFLLLPVSLHQVRSCLRTLVLKTGALSRKAWFCVLEQTTSAREPRAGVGRETLNQRLHYAQWCSLGLQRLGRKSPWSEWAGPERLFRSATSPELYEWDSDKGFCPEYVNYHYKTIQRRQPNKRKGENLDVLRDIWSHCKPWVCICID